jgi:predicted nucleic acid-binding Zn ribbon protein
VEIELDHRHCKVCGKPVDPEKDVCSKACRQKREQLAATRRFYTYLMYATIIVLVAVLAFQFLHL